MRMRTLLVSTLTSILPALFLTACNRASQPVETAAVTTPRLYLFDCGTIGGLDAELFSLKAEEIQGPKDFVTMCYLVVHPNGTLMWDAGQTPDNEVPANGSDGGAQLVTTRKLLPQLAEVGYKPEDITYFAMSHYHSDHTANANAFANATWIVQESERATMFADPAPPIVVPAHYSQLKDAKTIALKGEDHDVFGDGTVVIKYAPGHTPGHQMLFLKLEKFGPLLLAGDLYHYPEEKTLDRVPTFDVDAAQTREARRKTGDFLKETGAKMWIQHDKPTHQGQPMAPMFIE